MSALIIPSARQPVVVADANGNWAFSRPWFLFFQKLLDRVGGSSGDSIPDVIESVEADDGNSETTRALYALTDQVASLPGLPEFTPLDFMAEELRAVRDELTELRKAVEGLQQGTSL